MKYLLSFLLMTTFCNTYAQQHSYASKFKDLKSRYSNLRGLKIKDVIKQMHADSTQVSAIEDPPFILIGISIDMGDSLQMECYVERTALFGKPTSPYVQRFEYIENKKVEFISVFDKKEKKFYQLNNEQ